MKVKNVLELGKEEMDKIGQIREFMQEQASGLKSEIDELNQMIIEESQAKNEDEDDPDFVPPTQRDLKEYSTKL